MEPDQITAEINRLSLAQKLIIAQDIWDSIAKDSGNLPLPIWQKEELTKRYSQYKQGELEMHDWQDVHSKLREKYK